MEKEFAYESLPYSNSVFALTHTDKLCSIAKLHGLDAPNIENARVLELGCGKGMNLISQAFYFPKAEFVGIDLAGNHIEYAEKSVRELNLKNVEFRQCDLMEMEVTDFGKFDYITAHGLISWIPEPVREKTFSIYEEMLTEKGVGYISYNVYPGWYSRQMLRGIAKIHTKDFEQPFEKLENAAAFAKFLAENTIGDDSYKYNLHEEANRYLNSEPTRLFHDNLAEINEPYYFYEFAGLLDKYNLQFLAESQLFTMSIQKYPPEAGNFLQSINSIITREQYIDFFTGRTFRQTLFCRKENKLNRQPSAAILDKFYLSSNLTLVSENPDLLSYNAERFVDFGQNEVIEISHLLTKIALYLLTKQEKNSVICGDLLNKAKEFIEEKGFTASGWEEELTSTKNFLLQVIFNSELIEFHTYEAEINKKPVDKPEINSLVRWQLSESDIISAPYEKVLKITDPVLRKLLELLNGNNTLEDLHRKLTEFIKGNKEIENREDALETLSDDINNQLNDFASKGIFSS